MSVGENIRGDFKINRIQQQQIKLTIPKVEYKSKIEMPSKEFTKLISNLKGLADNVKIHITPK